MIIIEELNLREISQTPYSFVLEKDENNVKLIFKDIELIFQKCLILKCGYPNEEIYLHSDLYFENNLNKYFLYEIQESEWLKQIVQMNRVHPRHSDQIFINERHFLIYFEDETFECIARSYEILHNK